MPSNRKPRPSGPAPAPERPAAPGDPPITRLHALILAIIILLAAGVCFYGLDVQCLGLDELWTYGMSAFPSLDAVLSVGKASIDAHPPLHHILYYGIIHYVGTSQVVLRLPSAIAAFLAVPVVFLLGRRLYSTRVGLIAAGLMTVFFQQVFYAQEARANSMLVLLGALSIYLWIAIVRSHTGGAPAGWRVHVGYAATVLVLGYLHYFGTLFVAIEAAGLGVILVARRSRSIFLAPFYYFPLLVALVAWWYVWIPNLMSAAARGSEAIRFEVPTLSRMIGWISWAIMPEWGGLAWVVLALFGWTAVRAWLDGRASLPAPLRPLARDPLDRPATPRAGLLLVLWLVAPFAVVFVASFFANSLYNERNFMICLPALALLAARGIDSIPGPKAVAPGVGIAASAALFWGLVFGAHYYTAPTKAQFREAVGWVAQRTKDPKYDRAPVVGYLSDEIFYNYYFERFGSARRIDYRIRREWAAADVERLGELVRSNGIRYVWFVWAHWVPSKMTPQVEDYFRQHWTLVASESRKWPDGPGPARAEARLYSTVPPE